MLLTDAMADMTTRATTFSRKSRRSALPIVQATFLLGLCVATLASWVDRYTATPTVTYRRSLAAHSGESCTVRPAPQPCLYICAALALLTPLVNPGSLYRGGKGT